MKEIIDTLVNFPDYDQLTDQQKAALGTIALKLLKMNTASTHHPEPY